jgi:dolichol-phosphate mannosyltransferase
MTEWQKQFCIVMNMKYINTNAFKLYRREVMEDVKPILFAYLILTIELLLKAIIRVYSYTVVPDSWTNRRCGPSELRIKVGSRYSLLKYFSGENFKNS